MRRLHEHRGGALIFSREGVRRVDRAAVEQYAIPTILLMENAAWAIAEIAEEMFGGGPALRAGSMLEGALVLSGGHAGSVPIFCGPGNNGGDGFAAARKLHNLGRRVTIVLCADRAKIAGDARINLSIAERLALEIVEWPGEREALESAAGAQPPALIIDALLGTGQTRPAAPPMDSAVAWINERRAAGTPVLAVDIPTGLDCDSGEPLGGPVIRATSTITLAGMKKGFLNPRSREFTGEVSVGDIGVPTELLRRFAEP